MNEWREIVKRKKEGFLKEYKPKQSKNRKMLLMRDGIEWEDQG